VIVLIADVRVVPLGPVDDIDLLQLAERHQLVEGVVDRGSADLWQANPGKLMDLVSREVHVVTGEGFGDHAALGAEAPVPGAQPGEQIA
jgi:hypothetical protein